MHISASAPLIWSSSKIPLSTKPRIHRTYTGANVYCMNMYTYFVLWNLCLEFMWRFFFSKFLKYAFDEWKIKTVLSHTQVFKMNHIVKPSFRLVVLICHDQILLSPRHKSHVSKRYICCSYSIILKRLIHALAAWIGR